MKKMPILWFSLSILAAVFLFNTSQDVQYRKKEIRYINKEIAQETETLHVLEAEWNYLNRPERLEKLSEDYLKLKTINGSQLMVLDDIDALPVIIKEETEIDEKNASLGNDNTIKALPVSNVVRAKPVQKPLPRPVQKSVSKPLKKLEKKPAKIKTLEKRSFNQMLKNLEDME